MTKVFPCPVSCFCHVVLHMNVRGQCNQTCSSHASKSFWGTDFSWLLKVFPLHASFVFAHIKPTSVYCVSHTKSKLTWTHDSPDSLNPSSCVCFWFFFFLHYSFSYGISPQWLKVTYTNKMLIVEADRWFMFPQTQSGLFTRFELSPICHLSLWQFGLCWCFLIQVTEVEFHQQKKNFHPMKAYCCHVFKHCSIKSCF